jgi:YHS domain-containing protein
MRHLALAITLCAVCPACGGAQKSDAAPATAAAPAQTVCPVSGEKFTAGPNRPSLEWNGQTVQFCCPGCVGKFKANPEKYTENGTVRMPKSETGDGCEDMGGSKAQ